MKIAFYSHNSFRYGGGLEKQLLFISEALRKKGHDVKLYSLPMSQDRKNLTNISVSETSSWRHNIDADVLYITYHPFSSFVFKTECPTIGGIHSEVFFLRKISPKYGVIPFTSNVVHRLIGKKELLRFSAIHVNNKILAPLVSHPNVYYVPNCVDVSVYKPYIKDENFTVAFVGRGLWQKGWDIFQKAIPLLKRENIRIKCVGKFDKMMDGVTYTGFLSGEELARTYSSVHAVIYPTRADVFGNVIVESLLCGTPVITTRLMTRKGLELPLIYADDEKDILSRVLEFKHLWLNDKTEFFERCDEYRSAAIKYDARVVVPKFESMLEEVAKCEIP